MIHSVTDAKTIQIADKIALALSVCNNEGEETANQDQNRGFRELREGPCARSCLVIRLVITT